MNIPIGTSVQYTNEDGQIQAAIVTWSSHVNAGVDLTVFGSNGNIDSYSDVEMSRVGKPNTWCPLS